MLRIGVLQFELEIEWAKSLKDKRSVVKSLKDRSRKHFNVSIAEVDSLEDMNLATLAAVMAGNDVRYINGALDKFLETLRSHPDATLADHQLEIL